MAERSETFACFGGQCSVLAEGAGSEAAVAEAKHRLLGWHHAFSRFERGSELSALNGDPREAVPVSPMMLRIVSSALRAAEQTGGLVDPTLAAEIERAGYDRHFDGASLPLGVALPLVRDRGPAGPAPGAPWRHVEVDRKAGVVVRPPGLRLDPGGIAKGVFADELAAALAGMDAIAVDCAGDIRLGGVARRGRDVHVESPFDGSVLHTFHLTAGGIATSGIGRRSWLDRDGAPAHHLLDPSSGKPAFTGIVQATALAPTATEAEALSKAALLSGPDGAAAWLRHGGVIVLDDGRLRILY